jgi:hypothetical protein
MSYKFGIPNDSQPNSGPPNSTRHDYGNVYKREIHPKWSRVTFAPNNQQIFMMLEIAKGWKGSFGILYVLTVSRRSHEPGRYQSPKPCSFKELELFAHAFQDFFEGDGRHHLWFTDVPSGNQLVYDNHNLVYSYGDDERTVALLKSHGFSENDPRIPCPHLHCFNQEFDNREDEIMKYFEWKRFPLQEKHDTP